MITGHSLDEVQLDQLIFFALARIYPEKSDGEIARMVAWGKRRLSHFSGRKSKKTGQ